MTLICNQILDCRRIGVVFNRPPLRAEREHGSLNHVGMPTIFTARHQILSPVLAGRENLALTGHLRSSCPEAWDVIFRQGQRRTLSKQNGIGGIQSARALRDERVQKRTRGAIESQHTAVPATVHVEISVPAKFQSCRIPYLASPRRNEHVDEGPGDPVVPQDRIRSMTGHIEIPVWPED